MDARTPALGCISSYLMLNHCICNRGLVPLPKAWPQPFSRTMCSSLLPALAAAFSEVKSLEVAGYLIENGANPSVQVPPAGTARLLARLVPSKALHIRYLSLCENAMSLHSRFQSFTSAQQPP